METILCGLKRGGFVPRLLLLCCYSHIKMHKSEKKKTARNGEGLHGLPLDDVTNSRQRTSQRGIHGDSSLFPQICSL